MAVIAGILAKQYFFVCNTLGILYGLFEKFWGIFLTVLAVFPKFQINQIPFFLDDSVKSVSNQINALSESRTGRTIRQSKALREK